MFLGCGYCTGTQVRVPAQYICMGSSHAYAIVQVAVSRNNATDGLLNPTVRTYSLSKFLTPIATLEPYPDPSTRPFHEFPLPVL